MSDFSQVEGSWLACDGEWYPPQSLADWRREHPDSIPSQGWRSEPMPVPSLAEPGSSESRAVGWWRVSDCIWTQDNDLSSGSVDQPAD